MQGLPKASRGLQLRLMSRLLPNVTTELHRALDTPNLVLECCVCVFYSFSPETGHWEHKADVMAPELQRETSGKKSKLAPGVQLQMLK